MEELKRRSWRNFLVKKQLQLRFIAVIGIVLICMMSALCLVTDWAIDYLAELSQLTDPSMLYRFNYLKNTIYLTSGVVVAANFVMLAWLSHFVAGPIYRLERTFVQMQTGDLSMKIKLRKHDELQDTADLLNGALSQLRTLLERERGEVDKTLEQIQDLETKWKAEGRANEAHTLHQTLRAYERNSRQIKTTLS